eukprot:CAMPEP_0116541814 /NCGR_PEP_ID=MMETSP0397-20121206/680_1 /TAXON_ID=216820 /ORGANISM="Cyclophora tenuis, Strain ECT3854" /LENGTH=346 /DNA_ID=CAMNT_0004065775 /DNA_START=98 /DNA_END=1138 /DNA_ORIENTATION=-
MSDRSGRNDDDDDSDDIEKTGAFRAIGESVTWNPCDTLTKRILWCSFLGVPILILSVVLLSLSLKKLNSTQYGIQYNRYKKQLDDAVRTGGLHAGPPGYRFIKFPSTFTTVDLPGATCVSRDGLRVEFSVTFQYQMPREWLVEAVLRYRNFERWATVVQAAGNSAVQHSCSEFDISNFQNKRGVIQSTMETNLRTKLEGTKDDGSDGVFARAISLQLSNVELPSAYRTAVAEKQQAAEDISLASNQRTQETTKAQTELLTAQEEARKILDTARNDAEVTLTEARLKANETLFAFTTEAEVISRVKSALNLTTDGVLAYLANDLIAEASNLTVAATEPAKFSRRDEL